MTWQEQLKGDSLTWLLEENNPGLRYLTLRYLLDTPTSDVEMSAARELAHTKGPIAVILKEMHDEGYWVKPGHGYMQSSAGFKKYVIPYFSSIRLTLYNLQACYLNSLVSTGFLS